MQSDKNYLFEVLIGLPNNEKEKEDYWMEASETATK